MWPPEQQNCDDRTQRGWPRLLSSSLGSSSNFYLTVSGLDAPLIQITVSKQAAAHFPRTVSTYPEFCMRQDAGEHVHLSLVDGERQSCGTLPSQGAAEKTQWDLSLGEVFLNSGSIERFDCCANGLSLAIGRIDDLSWSNDLSLGG